MSKRRPVEEYRHLVASGQIHEDKHQMVAMQQLQRLYDDLVSKDKQAR